MKQMKQSDNPDNEIQDIGRELTTLERSFIGLAKDYADREGKSFEDFQKEGIPKQILFRAGIYPESK